MAEKSNLHKLSELGQSVWIDYLSRDLLRSGELARMMREDAVVGVTSNPTIFQKAIAAGEAYDDQLREVLAEERDPKEIFLRLAIQDVSDALDLLTEAVLVERHESFRRDLAALYAGYYVAELLHDLTDHHDPHPGCSTQPG